MLTKLGSFTEEDLNTFLLSLNADSYHGKLTHDRFSPAFSAPQFKKMVQTLDAFNDWSTRIWNASDQELDELLDSFWDALEVAGAGISLPTAIMYLRDPEQYNIWIPVMSKGLQLAAGLQPGDYRKADSYRLYNRTAALFREKYEIEPCLLDLVLWKISGEDGSESGGTSKHAFTGFVPDTFAFLKELSENNTDEWMHRNNDENELRFRQVLREPLRALFLAVAPAMSRVDPNLETRVKFGKVLATIKKRWPDEEGPYHNYLWGAFYRRDRTKQSDAQLFVNVFPGKVRAGFSLAGSMGASIINQFRRNLQQSPEVFLSLLRDLQGPFEVMYEQNGELFTALTSHFSTTEDLNELVKSETIDICCEFDSGMPVVYAPEFANEVEEVLLSSYPLFEFAIASTPEELSNLVAEPEEDYDVGESEPLYDLSQLSDETYLGAQYWAGSNNYYRTSGKFSCTARQVRGRHSLLRSWPSIGWTAHRNREGSSR